ncbi:MAG TPA: transglycosylase SLT domain-containing protein [Polyangia bacterium]|jgi:soluble lytic murein transglycosylase
MHALALLMVVAANSGKTPAPSRNAVGDLSAGFAAYRAGAYASAARVLGGAVNKGLQNDDWALFLAGESQFYEGDFAGARARFEKVSAARGAVGGRPAQMAPWRVADCLWAEGEPARAAAAYAKLVGHAGAWQDPALARFRIAEVTATKNPAEARRQWATVARDFPAHPLADEALRRSIAPASTTVAPSSPSSPSSPPSPPPSVPPQERLKRAETLSRDRHWSEALDELALLPAELPPALAAERDFQIGETKFHMRRDYPKAAELLLAVAPKLTGDKAAEAAFHGARALSRVDRDDEAIAGYHQVITTYPRSRFAAEAQYLSGWLDYNRGRFRESLPALQATLDHFGSSPFADDAAWCLAFAHYLLGDNAAALAGLSRYASIPSKDMPPEDRAARVSYWRARIAEKSGRADEARATYRQLSRRPFSFYGLLSRARLKAAGEPAAPELPAPTAAPVVARAATPVPELARARELLDANMDVESGWEAERREKDVLKHLAGGAGLSTMLDAYRRGQNFHRAYQLAETHGGDALGALPQGAARAVWEAAYPRAFADLVEKFGPGAGNPDLFLYAIMRKESGFAPDDVSYADARGLLQMIPPTSTRVAAGAGEPFFPDQLFEPATNVRLGAAYIGALFRKFGQQVPLAAGAYNAGPRAMTRWCDQHAGHPTDEFVELVAFAQTREYVKRVSAIYARYRFLYGPTPFELPLTLDLHYRADGPDY